MEEISYNNLITLTRGDSFSAPLFINAGSDLDPVRFEFGNEDELYMAIMEPNQPFECAIVKKKWTKETLELTEDNDVMIRISDSDTYKLMPGKYYYTVKLRLKRSENSDYEVNTIIPNTEFIIEE